MKEDKTLCKHKLDIKMCIELYSSIDFKMSIHNERQNCTQRKKTTRNRTLRFWQPVAK